MGITSPISVVVVWKCDTGHTGAFANDTDGHPRAAESLSIEPTWPVQAR
jgi:hypothetical protein